MTYPPLTPRPAATLILLRNAPDGMEVLMLQRSHRAAFIPGGYVFPGGAVDPADSDPAFLEHVAGMDEARASQTLNLDSGGMAFWIAAVRECFEEAGLLMAYDRQGRIVDADSFAAFCHARTEIAKGNGNLLALCRDHGLRLALDRMAYCAHWITQLGAPRRFTTRFFVALAPEGQTAAHDTEETIHHLWIRPQEALIRRRSGDMKMAFATVRTLEMIAAFNDPDAFLAHARTIRVAAPLLPRYARKGASECILLEGDPAYAEIGKLDLTGAGTFSAEIVPGQAVQLSGTVRRLTAANSGIMTGPGTNTYILGNERDFAVIDPGPADDRHIDALLDMTGGRIRWILATHTHLDHSPAAGRLRQQTGAQLLGMPAKHHDRQDLGFQPDRILDDGEVIELAGCRLRAIHTPGHAANHLCYLLEDENMLFTGDHIMQGSTVIINPPDGDMAAYMHSLEKIRQLNADYLAPGHGFLMDRPELAIDALLQHRMRRERKILEALSRAGSARLSELLPLAYGDVPEHKHRAASRSLLAHLLKLANEGLAANEEELWTALPESGHRRSTS